MLRQQLIALTDEAAWQTAIQSVPHTYTHTHWYNKAMQRASLRDIFLYHAKDTNFSIICPISPRCLTGETAADITTPYGFSGFAYQGVVPPEFLQQWCDFLAQQGFVCGHIAQHPLFNVPIDSVQLHSGKNTYFINLNQPLETIFKNFAKGHKYEIKKWQKENLQVEINKQDKYVTTFLALYKNNLQQKQAAAVYDFGIEAWQQLMATPHVFLFTVTHAGTIEAAAVFIAYENIVDYYMSASTEAGKRHSRAILWQAIAYFKQQEITWLHLGCGVKANDPLELFKARFGGMALPTQALKQIYIPALYQQLCEKYGIDDTDMSGYFPGYWQNKLLTGVI